MFAAIDAAEAGVRMTGRASSSPRASRHVRRAGQPSRAHVTLRRHPPRHPEGREFWSARDLMPLLGYGADWRNFHSAIEARPCDLFQLGIKNNGLATRGEFRWRHPKLQLAGLPRRMSTSRGMAPYLVAMNGDPQARDHSAQTYFAIIKTRQAEVAPTTRALPRPTPPFLRELATEVEAREPPRPAPVSWPSRRPRGTSWPKPLATTRLPTPPRCQP